MGAPLRVLVVDDHPVNLKLMRLVLEAEGYVVRTASTAYEALALINDPRPELVLMDLQLPDMDGLSLTQILKKDPRFGDIPIIAVTAYAMKGDEATAMKAGCDGYVTKPIDLERLSSRIREVMAKR